ncbi:multicopper oxidase domain-containing protein [Synechococcus sp. UW140]|uniref:multicopper oxidase family protein n=1 Tax=Synechococcus sp. UW140 TaxID=368503 RepID=UPI003137B9BD
MTSEILFFLVQAGFFKNNISLLFQFIIQLAESSKGSTPSNEVPVTKPTTDFNYIIGGLFPTLPNGNPNVILAEGLAYEAGSRKIISTTNDPSKLSMNAKLNISTDSITIPGADQYLNNFYLPQLLATNQANSTFNQLKNAYINNWTSQPRNRTMEGLSFIGYTGPGKEFANNSDSYWSSNGTTSDSFYTDIQNIANYNPAGLWKNWKGDIGINSTYDLNSLKKNLDALNDPNSNNTPPLWYPTFLYTYSELDALGNSLGTSYPGPTLFAQPGNKLNLNFKNQISVPGLTSEELQKATLIKNSSYGNSSSDGLGGSTSVNYHLHGSHTTPTGFGDNVVSRYTTGQEWTTKIDLPSDHGIGSYWYHPHYHPSVNQQVYGGLSGFLQLGDPLSKVPNFKNIPRNLAILKNIDLTIDQESGKVVITSLDGGGAGKSSNQMTMVTVNGQFQPTVNGGEGGWQAITLSNQTNQAFYNISFVNTSNTGKISNLPIYIFGEDGHQYPQILAALGTLGTSGKNQSTSYAQQPNLLSLPPGKRLDALVYLPQGTTQITSTYSFTQTTDSGLTKTYNNSNMGGYPDLISSNTPTVKGINTSGTGAGPLAIFQVNAPVIPLSAAQQNDAIASANAGISVQKITPETRPEEYNSNSVPSINLFEQDVKGKPLWEPIRNRQFNWAKGTLVGPSDDWDPATQELLAQYTAANQQTYQRYTALPVGDPGVENWLGYNNPFLINDHVFPNGNLTIAQLGTIEEWTLRNWSVNNAEKYIGHPFHIHINDYQTLNSDTELTNKNVLEDVTMLNSSGFKYYNTSKNATGNEIGLISAKPLRGSFHEIAEAQDPNKVDNLATFGANDQTIRMLFQDYLGTYVFHCHILPHEDAGMMQAIMVIENTDSSWLLPADNLEAKGVNGSNGSFNWSTDVLLAESFLPKKLNWEASQVSQPERSTVGDLTGDFIQEITIASKGSGQVRVMDGAALLKNGKSVTLSTFDPYPITGLAPWVFADDVTGDDARDLITGGFVKSNGDLVSIHNFELAGWTSPDDALNWLPLFRFKPWDSLPHHGGLLEPRKGLTVNQVSMAVGDFNLDNFSDIAMAYATEAGARVTLLDGAALSLTLQTGSFEGGYFPNQAILADAIISDPTLAQADDLSLSSGFNLYGQIALENFLLTAQKKGGDATTYTLQLEAGHFIATSEPIENDHSTHSDHSNHGNSGSTIPSAAPHHSNSGANRAPKTADDVITNLQPGKLLPVHIVDINLASVAPNGPGVSITPLFGGAMANGGLLVSGTQDGNTFVFAQGNGVNGTKSTSAILVDSADQLAIGVNGINLVNSEDLIGLKSMQPEGLKERFNLVNMAYWAYFGESPEPTGSAFWANKAILADNQTADEFTINFISTPTGRTETQMHFGGALNTVPIASIVETTAKTLWGRNATKDEITGWQTAVNSSLNPSLIPLRMLQSSNGNDLFRVAYLSAASEWTNSQWATSANVVGNFGLGFEGEQDRFAEMSNSIGSAPVLNNFQEAQNLFNRVSPEWLQLISGTEVSKSGFF